MDEQNDQNNLQSTPNGIPPAYVPPETPPPADLPPAAYTPPGRKKPLLIALCTIIALALVLGLPWLYVLYSKPAPKTQSSSTSQQPDKTAAFSQPDRLLYYRSGAGQPTTVYARSIATGEQIEALTLPSSEIINSGIAHNNQAALTVRIVNGDKSAGEALYYSSDSGKTYQKIYSTPTPNAQITSFVFSNDGKALAAGILSDFDGKNEVTEISLEGSHETKVLFTASHPGVFLQGYDRIQQKVLYALGCYNCDGNTLQTLYTYSLATNTEDKLYDSTPTVLSAKVSADFTKVLILDGKAGEEYFSTTAPYNLFTIDLSTKAKETIRTFDDGEALQEAGYTPEGTPYIATKTRVREVTKDKLNTLFELSGDDTSQHTFFAGARGVLATIMRPPKDAASAAGTFSVMYAKPGNTTPTELLRLNTSSKGNETPLGVTSK